MPSRPDRDEHSRALVQQAGSGDANAVTTLLAKYLPDLADYVERHAGAFVKQKDTPADLVQSVCREVLEDLRRAAFEYRGEQQFRQWLYQAALHKIQGRGRFFAAARREAAREVPLADLGSTHQPRGSARNSPSSLMDHREQLERFRAALQQIDATSRQIVEWAYFEQVSHKEVAARMDITEAHSRVLLSRALARIARLATKPGA